MSLRELFANASGFRPENYPQGYKEKPYCPNTGIIEICAGLAGTELKPELFCGEVVYNARYSEGAIHWLESADFYPHTSCVKTDIALTEQMNIIETNKDKPDEKAMRDFLGGGASLDEKIKAAANYEEQKTKHRKREEILERWRKVVFETTCSRKGDDINPHFRQLKGPEELQEKEIISKVRQFHSSLKSVVGTSIDGCAQHCKQSPTVYTYRSL